MYSIAAQMGHTEAQAALKRLDHERADAAMLALIAGEEAEKKVRSSKSKSKKKKKRLQDANAESSAEAIHDKNEDVSVESSVGEGERAPANETNCSATPDAQPRRIVLLSDVSLDTDRQKFSQGEEESTLGGETTCIICFAAPKTHLAVPCGHVCACGDCAQKLQASSRKCPYCSQLTTMWVEMRHV